jgi:hypothetical protein
LLSIPSVSVITLSAEVDGRAKETECFLPLLLLEGAASNVEEERAGGFELELDDTGAGTGTEIESG